MPLTFSHPAAVLPFLRGGRGRGPLIASALVAGSLAPDLPYFAESLLPGSYRFGRTAHRSWAIPTLDVVLAAGLVAGWHGLLREPLLALLPEPWAERAEAATAPLGGPGGVDWQHAARFAGSAALGGLTHVAWDSFTHRDCAGVRLLPVLNRRVGGMPGYLALQWGSSVVGLGVLAVAATRTLRDPEPELRREPERGTEPERGPEPDPGHGDPERREPRRTVLDPPARRRATALLAASAVVGAVHRARRDVPKRHPGRRPTLSELTAGVCFGGGAGAVAGAAAYALAARLTGRQTRT